MKQIPIMAILLVIVLVSLTAALIWVDFFGQTTSAKGVLVRELARAKTLSPAKVENIKVIIPKRWAVLTQKDAAMVGKILQACRNDLAYRESPSEGLADNSRLVITLRGDRPIRFYWRYGEKPPIFGRHWQSQRLGPLCEEIVRIKGKPLE